MKPLLKWPGGKAREIDQIQHLIPEFDRYIEPFFGGGAMYFHLQPARAAINDVSRDLMEFYHLVRTGNDDFRRQLVCYGESFQSLLSLGRVRADRLTELFELVQTEPEQAKDALAALMEEWFPEIMGFFSYPLVLDAAAFRQELEVSLWDKLCRTAVNHKKSPFSQEDLVENLVTGLASGYYMYFRQVFNDWQLGRIQLQQAARGASFFFIREYCYGSMFRYNKHGEFNIPYGGMTYNKKDFLGKVESLFNEETASLFANTQIYCRDFEEFLTQTKPGKRDFLFLDPPYDTEFSDYEGESFTKLDQARLAVALSKTPAKFLLIIKNTPFIEALYSEGFYVQRFDKQYSYNVRSRNDRKAEHLVITNYKID